MSFRCFGNHWSSKCSSNRLCKVNGCTQFHSSLLHKVKTNPTILSSVEDVSTTPKSTNAHSSVLHLGGGGKVLLQMLPVTLFGENKSVDTFALIDTGSTYTLILVSVAEQLKLDGPAVNLNLNGVQQSTALQSKDASLSVSPKKTLVQNILCTELWWLKSSIWRLTVSLE